MKRIKTIFNSVISFFMIIVLILCTLFTSAISISATDVITPTISEDEVWRESWSSSVQSVSVNLNVDETGLYNLHIMDYEKTACFLIYLTDTTTGEKVGYVAPQDITGLFITAGILFIKDHVYELECVYYNYDKSFDTISYADADLAILFSKSNEKILEIPNCAVSSSDLQPYFTETSNYLWLKYKTDVAGDYSFNFTNLYAYISVYDISTGKILYSNTDTMFYLDTLDDWQLKDHVIFNLEANTEYYICVLSYSSASTKLSMTKNTYDVKNIEVNNALYEFDCHWAVEDINYTCFDYKVTYGDETCESLYYYDIYKAGYDVPSVKFLGGDVNINGNTYLYAGEQQLECIYNGVTTIKNVYIKSLTDLYSYLDPIDEYDDCVIKYEDDAIHTYFWHINMSKSGFYGIWRYNSDDFATNFNGFSIEIVDETNNIVEYDENTGTWPLTAGKDYVLSFKYRYDKNYSNNDIVFWMQMEDTLDGWKYVNSSWYYYENGIKVTNCWKLDSNGWCYLSSDGTMATNQWVLDSVGWCYVGSDGYCVTNSWMQDSYGWVYLDSEGRMVSNQWLLDSVGWCYVGSDGYCVTNRWMKDSYGWVYLNAEGRMATNTWVMDSQGWCYVGADGYAVTNSWKKDSVGWCYLDSNGSMTKSDWVSYNNGWYYLNDDGYMVTGDYTIDGIVYRFNSDGIWIE